MRFLHVCIWTEGVVDIGHALLKEEGKGAELDLGVVPKAYEWNWCTHYCHVPLTKEAIWPSLICVGRKEQAGQERK